MDWFAQQLLDWHKRSGRKDLPWQQNITPYRVWVSEIMLQQTQVATVIEYYLRFMQSFPNVQSLAHAPLDEVLHHWTGLGYYARARNLHKAANTIGEEYAGAFPQTQDALESLPGIGRSTAGAIRAIAMQQHAAILDGNVKRVLARFHAVQGYPGATQVAKTLWSLAEQHTPAEDTATYTQAIMDLGATVCVRKNPACAACPLHKHCEAFAQGLVDQLPTPKPKKNKPIRQARFFVTSLPNQATLLEQRPPQGLWGGLWTPPERAADMSVERFVTELGLSQRDIQKQHMAPIFRHTFTHFHLDIEPVYLQVSREPSLIADSDQFRWVFADQLQTDNRKIGLSAPAVKLLAGLNMQAMTGTEPTTEDLF